MAAGLRGGERPSARSLKLALMAVRDFLGLTLLLGAMLPRGDAVELRLERALSVDRRVLSLERRANILGFLLKHFDRSGHKFCCPFLHITSSKN